MSDEELLREIYARLEVLRSQQSEINRRLGRVEKRLEDDEEAEDSQRSEFWGFVKQTIVGVCIISFLVFIGKQLGIEISW
ncbi:hypothetical protein [Brucella intermedia]|uniref:hypothetical protein n=1 Tax=Brucella intermedia TaxID=94625 RepID=UPI00224B1BC1|nr:hypothetical protein [Brucella intermedia]